MGSAWHRVADTARPVPTDITSIQEAPPLQATDRYAMAGRSVLVLVSRPMENRAEDPTSSS